MQNLKKIKNISQNAKDIVHSVLFTSFDDTERTPLTGDEGEDKNDFIDYLNSYIDQQGVQLLNAFTDVALAENTVAMIDDIFEEGVSIRYLTQQNKSQLHTQQTNTSLKHPIQTSTANSKTDSTSISLSNDSQDDKPDVKRGQKDNRAQKIKSIKQATLNLKNNADSKTVFIPFRTQKGRPVERLYLLGAEAQIKQGIFDDIVSMILPSSEDKHDFVVTDIKSVSKNMIRIYIKSDTALPQDDPGYAYRFELNHATLNSINSNDKASFKKLTLDLMTKPVEMWQQLQPLIERSEQATTVINTAKKYGLLTALEVYKRIPESSKKHKAQPIAAVVEKRYYTLRQLKRNQDEFSSEVDIYIHNDTPGSVWAKSLQVGDKIKVDTHYHETIKQMTTGQPLYICDETSMPTVAAMLERWQIDTVPIVISITNDKADFDYFKDMTLPDALKNKLQINYINTDEVDNLADSVIDMIKAQNKTIDCAWGGIGKADFRPIKQFVRDEYGLSGRFNRIRAYWV